MGDQDLVETIPPPRFGAGIILLVDDQVFLRRTLALALREHGFEVLEAGDVEEAIRHLESEPSIRAVVTDLVLPGRSGMALLRHARAERPEVPVVLMSAFVVDHDVEQARAAGALACLSKPFSLDELVPLLCRVVAEPLPFAPEEMPLPHEETRPHAARPVAPSADRAGGRFGA